MNYNVGVVDDSSGKLVIPWQTTDVVQAPDACAYQRMQ